MDLSLSSRFKNAWNAFRNRAPTMMSQNIGSGYSYRPDRFRLTRGNERSIVTSNVCRWKPILIRLVGHLSKMLLCP